MHEAFVIHTRAFRETSLIVDFFCEDIGRVSCIAKSARGPKSRFKGVLQAFAPLLIDYYGRNDLLNLKQIELIGMAYDLSGNTLISGLYLNELLSRLLLRAEPMPELFSSYKATLQQLVDDGAHCDIYLRYFEKQLLVSLGYALPLTYDYKQHTHVKPEHDYYFDPQAGFCQVFDGSNGPSIFSGKSLIALDKTQLSSTQSRRDAKRLMRQALAPLLGNKPLKSRELFV